MLLRSMRRHFCILLRLESLVFSYALKAFRIILACLPWMPGFFRIGMRISEKTWVQRKATYPLKRKLSKILEK